MNGFTTTSRGTVCSELREVIEALEEVFTTADSVPEGTENHQHYANDEHDDS